MLSLSLINVIRKTWVYALTEKLEVFVMLKMWKTMVEKEASSHIKALKSDNGSEYMSKEFEEYLNREVIHELKTIPRTPQENSVAKRINETILDHTGCIKLHAGLPLHL